MPPLSGALQQRFVACLRQQSTARLYCIRVNAACRAQALPTSLRALKAYCVAVEAVAGLTALERLSLVELEQHDYLEAGTTCGLSVLQRLTLLRLSDPGRAELESFASCTGLRTLSLIHSAALMKLCTWEDPAYSNDLIMIAHGPHDLQRTHSHYIT